MSQRPAKGIQPWTTTGFTKSSGKCTPICSPPTAAAWATHIRQARALGGCLGSEVDWDVRIAEAKSREKQVVRWTTAEWFIFVSSSKTSWRGTAEVRCFVSVNHLYDARHLDGQLLGNYEDKRWTPCATKLRNNLGLVTRHSGLHLASSDVYSRVFGECGDWDLCRRWCRRSLTFPIDKCNIKEVCKAVRLVNGFSPDSKAFYSYLWRRQP